MDRAISLHLNVSERVLSSDMFVGRGSTYFPGIAEFFTNYTKLPILASEAYYVKTKKSSNKMIPPLGIEPAPVITSDSKSNTILSGLSWHLLVRLRL